MASEYKFTISTADINYDISIEKPLNSYNNIYTLDINARILTPGKLLSRSILLVTMRVALTLIIEGIRFWKFGFRKKESWVAFFIINLLTQGALNVWINGLTPMMSYLFFLLIFAEIQIVLAEMLLFLKFVKELPRYETIPYVLVVNVLSLILGGYIITILPI